MCVILTIYQQRKSSQTQKQLLSLYEETKLNNPNGIGVVAFNKDNGQTHYYREMDKSVDSFASILKKYQTTMIHFRIATSGTKNVDNVHFWQENDWYFAHNGMISGLVNTPQQTKSDSYLFFRYLVENKLLLSDGNVKIKTITKASKKFNLWGRFILFNDKHKKATYFGDWHTYKIGQTLIIASTKLDFQSQESILGFNFSQPAMKIRENIIESCVLSIDFINEQTKILKKEFKPYTQSFGFATSYDNYPSKYPYSFTPKQEKFFDDGEKYYSI